jgi:uncharacterized membrane protein
MWSSIGFLQAVSGWGLVVSAAAGIIAAAAGFMSGLAGNRLNDLQKAAHERELEAVRLETAKLSRADDEIRQDIWFNM